MTCMNVAGVFALCTLVLCALFVTGESTTRPKPKDEVVSIAAANLASTSVHTYGKVASDILFALDADIVGLQRFNVGLNSEREIREFIDDSFGPGFTYYRDPTPDMPWPTGIVYRSKYKLLDAGHWPSPALKQRGATFVRLDLHNGTADITDAEFDAALPGDHVPAVDIRGSTENVHVKLRREDVGSHSPLLAPRLLVVSVHLSGNSRKRAIEVKALIQQLVHYYGLRDEKQLRVLPECIAIVGEFGTFTSHAVAVMPLKELGLFREHGFPHDPYGNHHTDIADERRRNYVMSNVMLLEREVTQVWGIHSFPHGMVFDTDTHPADTLPAGLRSESSRLERITRLPVVRRFHFVPLTLEDIVEEERHHFDPKHYHRSGIPVPRPTSVVVGPHAPGAEYAYVATDHHTHEPEDEEEREHADRLARRRAAGTDKDPSLVHAAAVSEEFEAIRMEEEEEGPPLGRGGRPGQFGDL